MQDKKITAHRIESLDLLRGLALMFIILFHASIYNFANINKIDFSNPPIIVVLMSFMALWGGIFIIYSMIVNAIMALRRIGGGFCRKIFSDLALTGVVLMFFHYILNIFLGRWSNDFINNRPNMTVVADSLRNMRLTLPHAENFFEGSSISTIAFNLIILSVVMFFMFRADGLKKEKRNYLILWFSGFLVMVLSFIRVTIFPVIAGSVGAGNYLVASFFSFFIANPYPLLPYLAYGIFGLMVGMMIYSGRKKLLKTIIVPTGIFFIILGLVGMTNFEKTISTPDYFWYFKTNFELGIFLLLTASVYLLAEGKRGFAKNLSLVKWFSRVTLSIYLLETLLSEILRIILFKFSPGWNQTINGCLAFGMVNVVIWSIIVFFWRKSNFKYSLEYYWVLLSDKIGKQSTKLDNL